MSTLVPLMNEPRKATPPPAWKEIKEAFDRHTRFIVTTHVNPDGDGLGAELGLWTYLRTEGKDVRILNPDGLPPRYTFLDREAKYEVYDPGTHASVIKETEVVVVLDISNWQRLDRLGKRLEDASALKICIDHHPFEDNGMADLYGVDLTAAATGQLVYEMIRDWNQPVDLRMAMGFYISILTDTGSFRFSNSDPRAHRVAAELIQIGLDPSELYERVYGNSSLARLRMMGTVLRDMRVECGGKILLLVLPQELLEETGALASDTEGFVDVARTVAGCEGVALLMGRPDGQVKVSLRSRGRMNVNRVASSFGGGGHVLASGATLPGPLDVATARLLESLEEELNRVQHSASDKPA